MVHQRALPGKRAGRCLPGPSPALALVFVVVAGGHCAEPPSPADSSLKTVLENLDLLRAEPALSRSALETLSREESEILSRLQTVEDEIAALRSELDSIEKNPLPPTASASSPESAASWWSFSPLTHPVPPDLSSEWVRGPVDRFALAKLEEAGLTPSPEADRRTLIRRLYFDLHGLPPSPEEIDAFLSDTASNAYEQLVDRLLASPRYGERWGRHWLDVVRYADTHGYDKDKRRPNAWPYRDYVIRSLNEDKPYGRFVQEQIAGDILFPEDPQGIVATGFIAAGPWDFVGHVELREGTKDKNITRVLDRDDMLSNTVGTFMSLTIHCARCHDHKFDPISQEDYYSLQSVFAGVDRADRPYQEDPKIHAQWLALDAEREILEEHGRVFEAAIAEATGPHIAELAGSIAALEKDLKEIAQNPENATRGEELSAQLARLKEERRTESLAQFDPASRLERETVEKRLAEVREGLRGLPDPQWVYAAASRFRPEGAFTPARKPRPVHLLTRGEVTRPGPEVFPRALRCVPGHEAHLAVAEPDNEGERRAALARWIADPKNAFTWRSIVNRVWRHHFGSGIVDTPNDFGRMGSEPTHPELLDWLASEFLANGQSLKWLHRTMVTSAAYRQASDNRQEPSRTDAGNRFLWRMNRQRLDAESLRDTILAISGNLNLSQGGPGFDLFGFKDDHSPHYLYEEFDPSDPKSHRRTVYRFIVRSVPDPWMECLDCADPSQSVPVRNTTLTALQALALYNDPFVLSQCEALEKRIQSSAHDSDQRIQTAFRVILGRPATSEECERARGTLQKHGLASVCRVLLNSNEFVFVD